MCTAYQRNLPFSFGPFIPGQLASNSASDVCLVLSTFRPSELFIVPVTVGWRTFHEFFVLNGPATLELLFPVLRFLVGIQTIVSIRVALIKRSIFPLRNPAHLARPLHPHQLPLSPFPSSSSSALLSWRPPHRLGAPAADAHPRGDDLRAGVACSSRWGLSRAADDDYGWRHPRLFFPPPSSR